MAGHERATSRDSVIVQLRLPAEMIAHLERVEAEFALPSRNAALKFVLNRDMKEHPSKGRE
jgi:hypothetical protein